MTSAIVHNLIGLAAAVADDDPGTRPHPDRRSRRPRDDTRRREPHRPRMVCVTAAQLGDWPNTLRVRPTPAPPPHPLGHDQGQSAAAPARRTRPRRARSGGRRGAPGRRPWPRKARCSPRGTETHAPAQWRLYPELPRLLVEPVGRHDGTPDQRPRRRSRRGAPGRRCGHGQDPGLHVRARQHRRVLRYGRRSPAVARLASHTSTSCSLARIGRSSTNATPSAITRPIPKTWTATVGPFQPQSAPKSSDAANCARPMALPRNARPLVRTSTGRMFEARAARTPSDAA